MSFVHRKRDGCARGRLFISRGSIGVKNGIKALFSHVWGRRTRRIWPFLSLTNGSFPSPADRLFTSLFFLFFSHHLDVIFRQAARSKMRLRWVCQFGKWNWDNQNLPYFLQEASVLFERWHFINPSIPSFGTIVYTLAQNLVKCDYALKERTNLTLTALFLVARLSIWHSSFLWYRVFFF